MRRFIVIILSFLVIGVLLVVLTPRLVPVDTLKSQVLARLEAATGRKVSVDTLRLSLFPDIALEAGNARISNPSWVTGDMASIRTLRIGVELLPLLHKELHLKELTLKAPVIVLIKNGSNANWQFAAPSAGRPDAPAPAAAGSGDDAAQALGALHVVRIAIEDGTLAYIDAGAGAKQEVDNLNVTLTAPDPASQAVLKGSAVYKGKKASIDLTLARPQDVLTKAGAQASLKAEYDPFAVAWKGTLALGGKAPAITGTLDIPRIDATPSGKEDQPATGGAATAAPNVAGDHWSDAPIDLSGLASAEADLDVTLDTLVLSHTTLSDVKAHARLAKGALSVTTDEIKAYGGSVRLSFAVNAINAANLSVTATGIEAKELAGSDKVTGTLAAHVSLTASGNCERAMVSALNGKGDVMIKDGTFKGVNLSAMMKNPTQALQNPESSTTAFSLLSGTFTIHNGVASNTDLKLESSSIAAGGEGQADLPRWQVNYLLKPQVSVGGGSMKTGVTVPVRVSGALDNPSYRPDMQAALKENLGNPAHLKAIAGKLLGGTMLNGLLR